MTVTGPSSITGLCGVLILTIDSVFVWYITSLSMALWIVLMLAGITLCILSARHTSKWFYVPAVLGAIEASGVCLGILFGK